MIEMSSVFKKKHKKIPPAFLHEGIFVTPRPYLNDIALHEGALNGGPYKTRSELLPSK